MSCSGRTSSLIPTICAGEYEMLRQVLVERASVTKAAADFGLSRPSFYEAQESSRRAASWDWFRETRPATGTQAERGRDEIPSLSERGGSNAERRRSSGQALDERRLRVHRRSIERALARGKKTANADAGRS